MMDKFDVIVIGGGAAGICAAISAARAGQTVVICEKNAPVGEKNTSFGQWPLQPAKR